MYGVRIGPDLRKLIPGKVVIRLMHDDETGLHLALTECEEIWSKQPGDGWQQVDMLHLALIGDDVTLRGASQMAAHKRHGH